MARYIRGGFLHNVIKPLEKTQLAHKHKVRSGAKRKQVDKISQDFADNVRKSQD